MNPEYVGFRTAVGSKWLTYTPVFAASMPLWFLFSILTTPDIADAEDLASVIFGNLASVLVCTAEYFLFRKTIWRASAKKRSQSVPVMWVVSGGLILGFSKASVTLLLSEHFSSFTNQEIVYRLLVSSILGVVFVIVSPFVLSQLEAFQLRREILIANLVKQYPPQSQETRTQILLFVEQSLHKLAEVESDPSRLPDLLDEIRIKDVRPRSHEIWLTTQERYPAFTVKNLLVQSVANHTIAPISTTLGFAALTVPTFIYTLGLETGIAVSLLQVAILCGLLVFARLIPGKGLTSGIAIYTGCAAVVALAYQFLADPFLTRLLKIFPLQSFFILFVLTFVLIIVFGTMKFTREKNRLVDSELEHIFSEEASLRVNFASRARENRELAELLHSQVQNTFLAKSVELRKTLNTLPQNSTLNIEILNNAYRDLTKYLHGLPTFLDESKIQPASEQLQLLSDLWSPVVDLTVSVMNCDLDELPPDTSTHVIEILNEALTNALRHGFAKKINIHLSRHKNDLTLTIEDDGFGPRQGAPGLGTMMLENMPNTEYSLQKSDVLGGAILVVKMRL